MTARMANPAETSPVAVVLRGEIPSVDDQRLVEILEFFGIPWVALTTAQVARGEAPEVLSGLARFSILSSAAELGGVLQHTGAALPDWMDAAASLYVYGFEPAEHCTALLQMLAADPRAIIKALEAKPLAASISGEFPDVCGPMSGLQVQLQPGAAHAALAFSSAALEVRSFVSVPQGQLFASAKSNGVRAYLDASRSIIDIHQHAAAYFDVGKQFAGAVPLVMYLRSAFREVCLTPAETNACVIIDDPLLQQRYGFLDFRELLQLMEKQNFATTIAFIPWNWRRTNRNTVAAFQQNGDKLSICIHGCDHSGAEFATRSTGLLERLLKTANTRMNSMVENTGLAYDRIMVFPQGAFSPEAGAALKVNGFVAAVNTEIAPSLGIANQTTVADLWSVAILRYGNFPIYTRRYMWHGIENFAFDGLLGKSCFLVGHHELLRDHGRDLLEFIGKLKSLHWKLAWRTLGNAASRSYRLQRRDGTTQLTMFAEQAVVENHSAEPQQMTVAKEEPDQNAIKGVTVNGELVDFTYADGALRFRLQIPAGGVAEVRCNYHEAEPVLPAETQPFSGQAKVAMRRYLSEFRDNYLVHSDFVLRAAMAARRMLKQGAPR